MRSKGFDRLKYAGCEAGKSLLNIQTSAMLKEPLHKRRGGWNHTNEMDWESSSCGIMPFGSVYSKFNIQTYAILKEPLYGELDDNDEYHDDTHDNESNDNYDDNVDGDDNVDDNDDDEDAGGGRWVIGWQKENWFYHALPPSPLHAALQIISKHHDHDDDEEEEEEDYDDGYFFSFYHIKLCVCAIWRKKWHLFVMFTSINISFVCVLAETSLHCYCPKRILAPLRLCFQCEEGNMSTFQP